MKSKGVVKHYPLFRVKISPHFNDEMNTLTISKGIKGNPNKVVISESIMSIVSTFEESSLS